MIDRPHPQMSATPFPHRVPLRPCAPNAQTLDTVLDPATPFPYLKPSDISSTNPHLISPIVVLDPSGMLWPTSACSYSLVHQHPITKASSQSWNACRLHRLGTPTPDRQRSRCSSVPFDAHYSDDDGDDDTDAGQDHTDGDGRRTAQSAIVTASFLTL